MSAEYRLCFHHVTGAQEGCFRRHRLSEWQPRNNARCRARAHFRVSDSSCHEVVPVPSFDLADESSLCCWTGGSPCWSSLSFEDRSMEQDSAMLSWSLTCSCSRLLSSAFSLHSKWWQSQSWVEASDIDCWVATSLRYRVGGSDSGGPLCAASCSSWLSRQ